VPTCDRLWTTQEVAAFLGVPVPTLHRWRYLGEGPEAFKVGRHLRWDPEAVRRWLVEDCQRSA
jgi:excisionase family DNA binding protein